MSLTNEAKSEVQRLLTAGQKIRAMKYLCDTFSISLAESKSLVAAMEAESSALGSLLPETDDEVIAEVNGLLEDGSRIEAIKFVKEWYDIDRVRQIEEKTKSMIPAPTHRRANPMKVFILIFGGIGMVLLLIACIILFVHQRSIASSDLLKGRVIDLVGTPDGYAPVVSFNYYGVERTYRSNVYSSPPAFHLDEQVELFVNRQDVNDIIINSFLDRWLAVTVVGGIGTFFLGFALLFGFISRKF